MKEFNSVEEILDFAIRAEQEAVNFYSDLAARSKNEQIKKVFQEFAGEEMKHKSRLLGIKEEKILKLSGEKVRDMKIADYLVDIAPKPDMPYGSTPNAITFNQDEAVLLVANADNNYLALFDITVPGES